MRPKPISGKVTANRPTGISRDMAEAARNTVESGWPRHHMWNHSDPKLASRLRVTPESQEA